jgi:Tfp pilus assembly protein PilF
MLSVKKICVALAVCLGVALTHAGPCAAQSDPSVTYHQIEGRVQSRATGIARARVRLLRSPGLRPVGDTFTRPDGQFVFNQLTAGEYVVETFETDQYEATSTSVDIHPLYRQRPTTVTVFVELPLKSAPKTPPPGTVAADVDLEVPKSAAKRYQSGMKALDEGDPARAVKELQAAVELYPKYYAARLELGRELRLEKRFKEAESALLPLREIAPRRAEPRIEYGIVLLALERRPDAVRELDEALRLEESSWAAHLYLGWALLESDEEKAAVHLRRALELDEQKAARAHLALARLADAKGERELAIRHLDAYLALAPDSHDAEAARKLADRLRRP